MVRCTSVVTAIFAGVGVTEPLANYTSLYSPACLGTRGPAALVALNAGKSALAHVLCGRLVQDPMPRHDCEIPRLRTIEAVVAGADREEVGVATGQGVALAVLNEGP